jgi:hypothetical protein
MLGEMGETGFRGQIRGEVGRRGLFDPSHLLSVVGWRLGREEEEKDGFTACPEATVGR